MPLKFWDEAFVTATYLINRLPSKVIQGQTLLERLFHQTPDYLKLRTFGCACWPNLRPYNSRKLQFRSKQCIFLGYYLWSLTPIINHQHNLHIYLIPSPNIGLGV